MEISNGSLGAVKRVMSATAAITGLVLLCCLPGCRPSTPAVASYQASLTNGSPAQAEEDRERIVQVFAEVAGQRGLVKEPRFPAHEGTLYFPSPTGLNLSLSALKLDEHSLAISMIPVAQGKKDDAGCRAVIAAVDQALQKNFGTRLLKSP